MCSDSMIPHPNLGAELATVNEVSADQSRRFFAEFKQQVASLVLDQECRINTVLLFIICINRPQKCANFPIGNLIIDVMLPD